MGALSWGKPKINLAKWTGSSLPTAGSTNWITEYPTVENSTKLIPTTGAVVNATVEGGGIEGSKRKKSTYVLEYEVRVMPDRTPKIVSVNGVVNDIYAVQLIPEDASAVGFLIDRSNVSVEDTWDAENGAKKKYTYSVLDAVTADVEDVDWDPQTDKSVDPIP